MNKDTIDLIEQITKDIPEEDPIDLAIAGIHALVDMKCCECDGNCKTDGGCTIDKLITILEEEIY